MTQTGTYTIINETIAGLNSYWHNPALGLKWDIPFVLPPWLEVWRQSFAPESKVYIPVFKEGETLLGIAPLLLKEDTVSLIGSPNVCDYLDFIPAAGKEREFFTALLDDLRQKGVKTLELNPVRPESAAMSILLELAKQSGYQVSSKQEDVSPELALPGSFDDYLESLSTTQRHEIRRKLRKLEKAGTVNYRIVKEPAEAQTTLEAFFKMFVESRREKSEFLTGDMKSYFQSLVQALSVAGVLRIGVLELDSLPVAMVMCFDYNDIIYLYNCGFDPRYEYLSVGLISKISYIRDSIEKGKKRFDFLKGNEPYKYHLGGKEVPIYNCQITLG